MNKLLTNWRRSAGFLFLLATLFNVGTVASAGEVVLTLVDTSGEAIVEMSEDDLLAMPQTVIITANEFVDGMAEFSGPLARDVVNLMGEGIETITLSAVNDYSVEVPVQDFLEYDVVFAMFQNGQQLSMRDKGPIWVIYPMTDFPQLQDRIYNDRLIWQLVRVSAK